ncbi:MAG: hypothetical protein ACR2MD_04730 [Aridibacter sp.]
MFSNKAKLIQTTDKENSFNTPSACCGVVYFPNLIFQAAYSPTDTIYSVKTVWRLRPRLADLSKSRTVMRISSTISEVNEASPSAGQT